MQGYNDVDVVGQFKPYRVANANGALLQFANHDARLYGANLAWSMPLDSSGTLGSLKFGGNASYTCGKRADGGDLYHMMPFNALSTLEHSNGAWNNRVESKLVARKERIDACRLPPAAWSRKQPAMRCWASGPATRCAKTSS